MTGIAASGGRSCRALSASLRNFLRGESGAGTAFALFGIAICVLLTGLAADFGNAWRQREVLRLSADVAAHAAAGILAKGGKEPAAMVAAIAATEFNTPEQYYGRVIFDPFEDVRLLHYNAESNRTSMTGPVNGVSVRLQRSDRSRNAVPTFFLGLAGIKDWDIAVESVAAVVPTERCRNSEGLFAHGAITLDGKSMIGSEVCLHSQERVSLPQAAIFASGSGLSMPDMNDCRGLCDNNASPGYASAATSMNLIMPKTAEHITRLFDGFSNSKETLSEETVFFQGHDVADDLSALEEVGVPVDDLVAGDVVTLAPEAFSRLRALPAGLVYKVSCSAEPDNSGILSIGAAATQAMEKAIALLGINETDIVRGNAQSVDAAPAPDLEEALQEVPRFVLDGMVLVTDCTLLFTQSAELRNAVIISTAVGPDAVLLADEGATTGDTALTCRPGWHSVVMALGSMSVPASFTASNAAFVIVGDVTIAGTATGTPAPHRGLSVHAGGTILTEGSHAFDACDGEASDLLPSLNIIKYVIPTDPLVTQ